MTVTTSRPSVTVTAKRAPKRATNGTLRTVPTSAPIYDDTGLEVTKPTETEWTCELTDGKVIKVRVHGENGRISWGGNPERTVGGQVRFYRTATAKNYDAVIPNITRIWSHNVIIEDLGLSKEMREAEEREEERKRKHLAEVAERLVKKRAEKDPWDDDEDPLPGAPF